MTIAERLIRYHQKNPEKLIAMVLAAMPENTAAREELTRKIDDLLAALPEQDNGGDSQ